MLVTPITHTGTPALCNLIGMPPRTLDGGGGSTGELGHGDQYNRTRDSEDAGLEATREENSGKPSSDSEEADALATVEDDGDSSTLEDDALLGDSEEPLSTERSGEVEMKTFNDRAADGKSTAEWPSFVFQRRKFVLKEDSAHDGDGPDHRELKFSIVEMPVGWQLER